MAIFMAVGSLPGLDRRLLGSSRLKRSGPTDQALPARGRQGTPKRSRPVLGSPSSWSLRGLLEHPVAPYQVVRRAVMRKRGRRAALELWDDALGQHLSQLDSPLV